jgi:nitrogen fixation/metabolism regulation signal transduction histidine kinase
VGIICIKGDEEIDFINKPALSLLGISIPVNWTDLAALVPEFTSKINDIQGRGSRLVEFHSGDAVNRLSVKVSTLVVQGKKLRIISFQDIRLEIEQKEVEAWQKLIRILRHEIMNSVTPISSMTETILMLVEDHLGDSRKASQMSDEDISDIRESIVTIHDRSEGLNDFLEQYKEVTRIPILKRTNVRVSDLVEKSLKLLEAEFSTNDIKTAVHHENPHLEIHADAALIEQVLINLLRNSIEALMGKLNKSIDIKTDGDRYSQVITIVDNGCGIPEEALDEIFVPFYSTKSDGTGIGLSFSRQIMHLHGGYIHATSKHGKETHLKLCFYSE